MGGWRGRPRENRAEIGRDRERNRRAAPPRPHRPNPTSPSHSYDLQLASPRPPLPGIRISGSLRALFCHVMLKKNRKDGGGERAGEKKIGEGVGESFRESGSSSPADRSRQNPLRQPLADAREHTIFCSPISASLVSFVTWFKPILPRDLGSKIPRRQTIARFVMSWPACRRLRVG